MAEHDSARLRGALGPAVAIVLVGSLAHAVAASSLAAGLVPSRPPGVSQACLAVVGLTTVAKLVLLYLRTQYSTLEHAARSVPLAPRIVPPAAAAATLVFLFPGDPDPTTHPEFLALAVPLVTATWASALMISLVEKRLLLRLARRFVDALPEPVFQPFLPPTLAGNFTRVLGVAATSASMIAIGALVTLPNGWSMLTDSRGTPVALAGLASTIVLALAAGVSLGQNPARDLVAIASRLDTAGHDAASPLSRPIVITSMDELGELFDGLEHLRSRLAKDLALYEDALARTRAADAIKSEFLGAVSHELRTPLNSVCGFAQLLLEGHSTPLTEAQAEDVRLILAGGHKLLDLINDILDISMIESGELRLILCEHRIEDLTADVVRSHQSLVYGRPIVLTATSGPDVPPVACDARRIGQILTNLVSNAIKFTEEGSITVSTTYDQRQDQVVVRVVDTGLGISPEDLDTIFEEYRQAGAAHRRKKGTGLGLPIARSLALHHGGSLTVESTVGRGSTFTLTLPRAQPSGPARPPVPPLHRSAAA